MYSRPRCEVPLTGRCALRTSAKACSTSGIAPYDVAVTYEVVRDSLPSGSVSYVECSETPATTSGCAAWTRSALMPPTMTDRSPTVSQVADPGPNKPGSPRWLREFANGYSAWENNPTVAPATASRGFHPGLTSPRPSAGCRCRPRSPPVSEWYTEHHFRAADAMMTADKVPATVRWTRS